MKRGLIVLAMCVAIVSVATAQTIIDKSEPERRFEVGVRAGFNTSNVSNNFTEAVTDMKWAHNNWKSGMTVGAVVDININNCFAIQPGLYWQSRRSDYQNLTLNKVGTSLSCIEGERHSNFIQIPILVSMRFTFSPAIKAVVDVGPYFAHGFGGKDEYDVYSTQGNSMGGVNVAEYSAERDYFGDEGSFRAYDWGIKMGCGLMIKKYYVGVHYDASCRNAHKYNPYALKEVSGRNKAWNFTVGYNF